VYRKGEKKERGSEGGKPGKIPKGKGYPQVIDPSLAVCAVPMRSRDSRCIKIITLEKRGG